MDDLALVLFTATFAALAARQIVGRGPKIWTILLAGAALTVAFGVLSPYSAGATIVAEAPVLLFLFALFVFVGALERSGLFEHLARWLLGRGPSRENLVLVAFVGFGVLSGFVLNDALVLVGVPLVFAVARRLTADPKPLLFVLAYAVTVGSVLTPFGNPQNLLVGLDAGFASPVAVFLRYLAVPTALNLVVGGVYLRWSYREPGTPPAGPIPGYPRLPLLPRGGWGARLARSPVLVLFPGTIGAVIALEVVAGLSGTALLPSYGVALIGALALLLVSPGRLGLVRHVDWSILVLFAGLFVVVAGAVAGGLLAGLERLLPVPGPSASPFASIGSLALTSLVGSQLVSNVPWVALQIPVLHGLGYGAGYPTAWMALAAGSTLAGNLTLLGAASNLILVEQAARRSVTLHLGEFARRGLPLTVITTGILLGCLLLGL